MTMGTSHFVLLSFLIGAALYCSVTADNSNGPSVCCSKFYPKRVDIKALRSFHMTENRCAKTGVMLVTKKSRQLCVDPNVPWVQRTMKILNRTMRPHQRTPLKRANVG